MALLSGFGIIHQRSYLCYVKLFDRKATTTNATLHAAMSRRSDGRGSHTTVSRYNWLPSHKLHQAEGCAAARGRLKSCDLIFSFNLHDEAFPRNLEVDFETYHKHKL